MYELVFTVSSFKAGSGQAFVTRGPKSNLEPSYNKIFCKHDVMYSFRLCILIDYFASDDRIYVNWSF